MKIEPAVAAILRAWRVEGINPRYHREQKERLRREWPALYRALEELYRESRRG